MTDEKTRLMYSTSSSSSVIEKRRKMPNKHIVSVTVIVIDAVKFAAVIFVVIVFIIASESRTGRVNDCGWLLRAQLRGVYKKTVGESVETLSLPSLSTTVCDVCYGVFCLRKIYFRSSYSLSLLKRN